MQQERKLRPEDTIFVVINPGIENFKEISTKFEMITASEYLFGAATKRKIPLIPCRRENPLALDKEVNSKHVTSFDDEFYERYQKVLSALKVPYIVYSGLDAFTSDGLVEVIKQSGRHNICIFGVPIEVDVIASA
ncbi:MAG: hypothetical protein QXU18_06020, partial [Thermoplasmatales archaeon]